MKDLQVLLLRVVVGLAAYCFLILTDRNGSHLRACLILCEENRRHSKKWHVHALFYSIKKRVKCKLKNPHCELMFMFVNSVHRHIHKYDLSWAGTS